jgi:hypothetical protein
MTDAEQALMVALSLAIAALDSIADGRGDPIATAGRALSLIQPYLTLAAEHANGAA